MSAERINTEAREVTSVHRPFPLRLLPTPRPILSPIGFGLLIALMVAIGLAAVMVATTSVAAQSRELTALRREAKEVGYLAASLTTELQTVSSTASLAMRATELGMVPNPYPAFIRLSDGTILGEPTPVEGDETGYIGGVKLPADQRPLIQVLPEDPVQETTLPAHPEAATEQAATGAAAIEAPAAEEAQPAADDGADQGVAANDHGADLIDEVSEESLVADTDGGDGQ